HPLPGERQRSRVVRRVDLLALKLLPTGVLRNVGIAPAAGRTHYCPRMPVAGRRLDDEPLRRTTYGQHPDRPPDRKVVALLILREVIQRLLNGGVVVLAAAHNPARQRVPLGRGKQPQRLPPMPPRATRPLLGIQNHEPRPRP